MQRRARVSFLLVGFSMIVCAGSASAQSTSVDGTGIAAVVSDPRQIAQCLCSAQSVSSRLEELRAAQARYADAKSHAEATRREVDALRPRVDPTSPEMLDAYRRLLTESERANSVLYGQAQPEDAKAVSLYNQAVASYNSGCAGQRFDANRRAQVAQTLICPAP